MPGSLRAGHKNRVYAAEAAVFGFGTDLDTAADVQAFCDKVVRSSKFRALWFEQRPGWQPGSIPPRVKVRHFTGSGAYHYYGSCEIRVGSRRRSRHTVLHELAHLIAAEHGHGRAFARVLLALTRRFLPEQAAPLLAAYQAHGVRWRKSPKENA